MGWLVPVGGLLGALLGGIGGAAEALLGLVGGMAVGALLARQHRLDGEIRELRRELAKRHPDGGPSRADTAARGDAEATVTQVAARPAVTAAAVVPRAVAQPAPVAHANSNHATSDADIAPTSMDRAIAAVKRWFSEGNVPVKVGMLVLFAGVGALLRYAQHQGWLRVPMGMRLGGLALVAIAALLFGWRERQRRRSFGLTLQGGAIGVLLMTVFAAFRLYHLLPAGTAFALMLVLVAATCWLSVRQDALALAVLAVVAGFAAPILSSNGSGSHVFLFSYYALFNVAIFGIAWLRSWRLLNLVGFAFTFLIGIAWGVLRYEPRLFDSTAPFLALYFAIYLAIPIVNGLRQAAQRRDVVDGTLVFGNPLLSFALLAGLLEGARMPLAWTALAVAAMYTANGFLLLARLRVLGESFIALASAFATLAVPLALSAWATTCVFAVEGAALMWLGFRQHNLLQRAAGLGLQWLAMVAWVYSLLRGPAGHEAFANGSCLGAMLIAAAGFTSAWLHLRASAPRHHALLLYLWGLAWWCFDGWREIARFVPHMLQSPALLAFAAATAALASLAWHALRQRALAITVAAAMVLCLLHAWGHVHAGLRPWDAWPLAAFAGFGVAGCFSLMLMREADAGSLGIAHGAWTWARTTVLGLAAWRLAADAAMGQGWRIALMLAPLLLAWLLALLWPRWLGMPVAARFAEWRCALCTSQAAVAGLAFLATLLSPGSPAPWPWCPLFNPLELQQLAFLLLLGRWLQPGVAPGVVRGQRAALLAGCSFLFITAATLRSVHHVGGLPWDASLWSSMLAQTSLTLVWSVLGVAGWVLGSRRGSRQLWLAGAVLMAVVLAKLLLVDRSHLGSVLGIVSFIAYGVLCTVIGYLAPAPPRAGAPRAPDMPG